jgi:hypothetical protein
MGKLEGIREYEVRDPKNPERTITDIDSIEGNTLWEEKSATDARNRVTKLDCTSQWLEKHIKQKFIAYKEAREHLRGYENATIGFRFTQPGVEPNFRFAVEKFVEELRSENPNVNIILEWK